jgi:structural maintenance of chromosome 2
VKGRLIKLFQIKEDRYARALEEVAQGRLYQIVVDTDSIAAVLLKHNCFPERETLIPNNKIQAVQVPQDII